MYETVPASPSRSLAEFNAMRCRIGIALPGGVLTILRPSNPVVYFRANRTVVLRGTPPMFFDLAATFSLVATLVAIGDSGAIHATEYGCACPARTFGISLCSTRIATRLTQPVANLGNRLLNTSGEGRTTPTAVQFR